MCCVHRTGLAPVGYSKHGQKCGSSGCHCGSTGRRYVTEDGSTIINVRALYSSPRYNGPGYNVQIVIVYKCEISRCRSTEEVLPLEKYLNLE
jgi:hypothetical protein